jgi:hypothetical protein
MEFDLTVVLAEWLSRNRGPDPESPGVRTRPGYVVSGSLEDDLLRVRLTFPAGRAFCCFEPGCHLALHDGTRWGSLRDALSQGGCHPPDRLRLFMEAFVESGSKSLDPTTHDEGVPGVLAFRAVDRSWSYIHEAQEGRP